MRILGIDYGTKRVGVALSDESRKFALPFIVIENKKTLLGQIEGIAKENGVKEVVVGESRDYKGEPNKIFAAAEHFIKELENRGFVVHKELEYMSSAQAERIQGKNEKTDASAAAIILQSYLDKN